MSLSIVTPWLDHEELLEDYLRAIEGAEAEVIIVDDASDPPLDFATIRLEQPGGFCGASNAGLAAATGEKILFLNNDVAAEDSSWLGRLQSRIEPGAFAGAALRTETHARVPGVSDPLTYLDGWCLGGMKSDLEMLGGWSEEYEEPAYYSDNDLCFRARCLGISLRECRVPLEHKLSTTALAIFPNDDQDHPHPDLQLVMNNNYQLYVSKVQQLLGSVAR